MAGSGMNYNNNNNNQQFADTSSLFGGPDPTSSTSFFDAIPQNSNASPPPPTTNSHSSPPQNPNSPPSRPLAASPSQQPQQQQVVGEASNLFTNDASSLFSHSTDTSSSQPFMSTPVASFPSTSPSPPNPSLNTAPQVSSPPPFAEQPTTQTLFAGPDSSSFFDNIGSSIPAAQQQYQAQYSYEQPSYEQQSTLPTNSSELAASSYNYDYNYSQNQMYGVSPQSFQPGYSDQYPQPEGQPQQGYTDMNGVTYQAQTDYSTYQQYQYQQSAYYTDNTQNYNSTLNENYQYDQYQSAHAPAPQPGSTHHQEYDSTQYQERQSAQHLVSDTATTQSYDTSQQYSTTGGQHSGYYEYSYPTSAAVASVGANSAHSNVIQSMVPEFGSETTPATIPAVIEDSTAETGSFTKPETHREENTSGEISTDQKIDKASVEPNVKSGTTDYTPAQTDESGILDEFEDITNSTVASNHKTEPKNASESLDSQTQASPNEIADLDDLVFGVNQMKVAPDSTNFTTSGKPNSSGSEKLKLGENGSQSVQKEIDYSVKQTRSNDVSGLFGDNGSNSSASFFSMPQPDQTAADMFATDIATSQMQSSGAFASTVAMKDMTASSYSASTDPQQWGQPASNIVSTALMDNQIPEYNTRDSSLDNTVSQTDPFDVISNASKSVPEQATPGPVNDRLGVNGIGLFLIYIFS
ncbi:hypothetical protein BKA69DRAFT_752308 [Paraphysoderma sedebokerense]|nr:hypothetical protein BKA69DRAFT_885684 [Paraphysoderma sedebokerense]KAI9138676.1 hypothetical protein BKA69DRAFT_752308 [Paraphysoderma sedebokerense]